MQEQSGFAKPDMDQVSAATPGEVYGGEISWIRKVGTGNFRPPRTHKEKPASAVGSTRVIQT